jgi:hypothetical protein
MTNVFAEKHCQNYNIDPPGPTSSTILVPPEFRTPPRSAPTSSSSFHTASGVRGSGSGLRSTPLHFWPTEQRGSTLPRPRPEKVRSSSFRRVVGNIYIVPNTFNAFLKTFWFLKCLPSFGNFFGSKYLNEFLVIYLVMNYIPI